MYAIGVIGSSNMLLYAVIFFSLGAIVTWLSFCWRMDRNNSSLYERIRALEFENDRIFNDYLAVAKYRDKLLDENIKMKKEATKCPE